jgi:hypothetical protein
VRSWVTISWNGVMGEVEVELIPYLLFSMV